MHAYTAETLSVGNVFLVGDAAQQVAPSGGFGLNTGLQHAHNLAWKLAAVHAGLAPEELLQSYRCCPREGGHGGCLGACSVCLGTGIGRTAPGCCPTALPVALAPVQHSLLLHPSAAAPVPGMH